MDLIAHIGNIPVEEWLPFLVPVLALYFYGRRSNRRHREAVSRLPDASEPLAPHALEHVLAAWAAADHVELTAAHVPLLYPPGPDGVTAVELAKRTSESLATTRRLLEDLSELGYVDLERRSPDEEVRARLTDAGCELVEITEDALIESAATPTREVRWTTGNLLTKH